MMTLKNIITEEKKRMDTELKIKDKLIDAIIELMDETKDETAFETSAGLKEDYRINLSVWTRNDTKFAAITIKKGVLKAIRIVATPDMELDGEITITEYKSEIKSKADLDRLYNMIKEL